MLLGCVDIHVHLDYSGNVLLVYVAQNLPTLHINYYAYIIGLGKY